MWKQMLNTELLEIQMDESNQFFELRLNSNKRNDRAVVRLNHADLIQLMHTLLEINRTFRGDIPYFASTERVIAYSTS
ncbi:hypothetical protein GK047_21815 [Paenibacillus sp. SYP-B3998]|uniref:Uncharacterized protein n=1 Tax=Paenibacillus sp. SYP-B3998 TaxID=2678564 RepID=A0A6G4A4R1_9BACL|nr:hypothetical protein [Paenibacillus sp. SYP-B3998]NEW08637.1 hypothetical protein [Paenibacillus sp. SYP-B3998]